MEALVAKLDGQVVSDLSIINAFAAEMTAEAALELSRADAVSLGQPGRADGAHLERPTPPTTSEPIKYLSGYPGSTKCMGDGVAQVKVIAIAVVDSGIIQ